MMIHKRLLQALSILIFLQLSACAVIHFDNGEVETDPNERSVYERFFGEDQADSIDPGTAIRFDKWYHHGLYQIAEISNPLDLNKECTGLDWNQVTTKTDPIDLVVGLIDNLILLPASSAGIDLWSHWDIEYSCRYQ